MAIVVTRGVGQTLADRLDHDARVRAFQRKLFRETKRRQKHALYRAKERHATEAAKLSGSTNG